MDRYFALVWKERTSAWGVTFPDFPGVTATADDPEAAIDAGIEALELALEEAGTAEMPAPRSLEAIMADADNEEAFAIAVPAPELRGHQVRVNISLDERLLAGIDRAAAATGETRSGFLATAARQRMATHDDMSSGALREEARKYSVRQTKRGAVKKKGTRS